MNDTPFTVLIHDAITGDVYYADMTPEEIAAAQSPEVVIIGTPPEEPTV